jgi:hypothetical protein
MGPIKRPIIEQVWVRLSHENGVVTNLSTSWFHVKRCKCCIHLRNLNLRHFGMVEGTRLKYVIQVTFNHMTTLLNLLKICQWGHRQKNRRQGDLIILIFFVLRKVGCWVLQH